MRRTISASAANALASSPAASTTSIANRRAWATPTRFCARFRFAFAMTGIAFLVGYAAENE